MLNVYYDYEVIQLQKRNVKHKNRKSFYTASILQPCPDIVYMTDFIMAVVVQVCFKSLKHVKIFKTFWKALVKYNMLGYLLCTYMKYLLGMSM